jgi:hypothetical protein
MRSSTLIGTGALAIAMPVARTKKPRPPISVVLRNLVQGCPAVLDKGVRNGRVAAVVSRASALAFSSGRLTTAHDGGSRVR